MLGLKSSNKTVMVGPRATNLHNWYVQHIYVMDTRNVRSQSGDELYDQ